MAASLVARRLCTLLAGLSLTLAGGHMSHPVAESDAQVLVERVEAHAAVAPVGEEVADPAGVHAEQAHAAGRRRGRGERRGGGNRARRRGGVVRLDQRRGLPRLRFRLLMLLWTGLLVLPLL
jgi:hypothetical protein